MGTEHLREALESMPPKEFVDTHLLEGVPYFFSEDESNYWEFRRRLATDLHVPPRDIAVVGSAKLGFSLNPKHCGREFHEGSDIDVVVVSGRHFDNAWLELFQIDGQIRRLRERERQALNEIKQRLFWGYIRPDKVPKRSKFYQWWWEIFRQYSNDESLENRKVRGRLFRTWWHVYTYYVDGVRRSASILREDRNA